MMWTFRLFLSFCFIFTKVSGDTISVFKGEHEPLNSTSGQVAKLKGVYPDKLGDISICLRFYNYHIERLHLMSFSDTFATSIEWSPDGNKLLLFQKFNNQFVQPDRQEIMEKLAPRHWHGYCFTYNKGLGARKVYVDAHKVLEDIMDDEAVKDIPVGFINNLYFMSKTGYPEWTMMTDINIWNVTLTPEEVEGWTNCKKKICEKNKIVDWKTANWTTLLINP